MPDEKLKTFVKVFTKSDADEALLDAVKTRYSEEISAAVNLGENLLDKAKTKIEGKKSLKKSDKPMDNTVPVLQTEEFDTQLRKTKKDAVSTVMRPDVPEYTKKSSLFKSLNYKVRADKVTATKEIGNNTGISGTIDVFDKSAGLGFEKQLKNERTRITGNIEYEPFDNALEANFGYNDSRNNFSGSIYLKEGNPGVSTNFAQTVTPKTSFSVSASLFQSDAAFKAEFDTKLKDNTNLSVGAYGSTKYKEIGVTAKIGF